MDAYLVKGKTIYHDGEVATWDVSVHLSLESAQNKMYPLIDKVRELGLNREIEDWQEREKVAKQMRKIDPRFQAQEGGSQYWIDVVPFGG